MMAKLSVKDLDVKGKKIFIRVDFNVPLDEGLHITDDTRIRAALPTIKYVLEQGGIPILASHLGRPKGSYDTRLSLKPVAERLVKLLDRKIVFADDCVGDEVKKIVDNLKPGIPRRRPMIPSFRGSLLLWQTCTLTTHSARRIEPTHRWWVWLQHSRTPRAVY
jgi:hypothetical protein